MIFFLLGFYLLSCKKISAQELEKDLHDSPTESLPAEKKLAIFEKIFSAYQDARSCIRNDLVCLLQLHFKYINVLINDTCVIYPIDCSFYMLAFIKKEDT